MGDIRWGVFFFWEGMRNSVTFRFVHPTAFQCLRQGSGNQSIKILQSEDGHREDGVFG